MPNAKHTPTPWFTEHSGVQKIYAQGAGDIAHVFANCLMGDCKANAAFIVKAVNSHEAQKHASLAALQYLCDESPRADRRLEVIEMLQAALAAVEAQ